MTRHQICCYIFWNERLQEMTIWLETWHLKSWYIRHQWHTWRIRGNHICLNQISTNGLEFHKNSVNLETTKLYHNFSIKRTHKTLLESMHLKTFLLKWMIWIIHQKYVRIKHSDTIIRLTGWLLLPSFGCILIRHIASLWAGKSAVINN